MACRESQWILTLSPFVYEYGHFFKDGQVQCRPGYNEIYVQFAVVIPVVQAPEQDDQADVENPLDKEDVRRVITT